MFGRVAISTQPAERISTVGRPGGIFLPAYIFYLLAIQIVYPCLYVHSPFLRSSSLLQIVCRLATWTLPVIIHLGSSRQGVFEYLKLRRDVLRGAVWGLGLGFLLVALDIMATFASKGHVHVNFQFGQGLWWKGVILVGFSEEVVFRGYLLREFARETRFWIANAAQALLFLAVHIPGWILLGQFSFPGAIRLAGYVVFVGLLLGAVWKRSRSLWACMLIHSLSNFCSFAIL